MLSVLARVAGRLGITAIPSTWWPSCRRREPASPPLDVSSDFISLTAEIGVLLLLLTLGLEYTADELRHGLRTASDRGWVDAVANFTSLASGGAGANPTPTVGSEAGLIGQRKCAEVECPTPHHWDTPGATASGIVGAVAPPHRAGSE